MYFTEIYKNQIDNCRKFANKFVFGKEQHNKYKSRKKKQFTDCWRGMMGQEGEKDILQKYFDLRIELDYEIYKKEKTHDDAQDFKKINGFVPKNKYDVKTYKQNAGWLIVEPQLLESDYYICCKISVSDDIREYVEPITVGYIGWASKDDFYDIDGNPWFIFNKGDYLWKPAYIDECYRMARERNGEIIKRSQIYKIMIEKAKIWSEKERKAGYPMDAKVNYGIPFSELTQDKNELIEIMENECKHPFLRGV